jgi:uncharacterized protein (TIGR03437 family)
VWLTGDPGGFGYLDAAQIASAAGGPSGPIAPGEVITLYGQGMGPEVAAAGRFNEAGLLETEAGGARVLFDDTPGPVFSADTYQITAQVPYEVAGQQKVTVRHYYREVPSNGVEMAVADTAPELFRALGGSAAIAINQNGSVNSAVSPAPRGSVVSLFATGAGVTSPPGVTGAAGAAPYARPLAAVELTVGGVKADVLFAGLAPGMVGVLQINALVPQSLALSGAARVPVSLRIGGRASQSVVQLWVE